MLLSLLENNKMRDWFFIQKMIFLIGQKKYYKVNEACVSRERVKGQSYETTYVLALLNYYKRDVKASFQKFKELVKKYQLKTKIEQWFIKNLIASLLFYEKKYLEVRKMCDELIPLLHDNRSLFRIHELNFDAQYAGSDYIAAMRTCDLLLELSPDDSKIQDAKKSIQKKLE